MNWEKIVEDNIKLVYYFSQNEDEAGAGMLGLVKGAKTYDESKGYTLSTYLGTCIQNEINYHRRKEKKHKYLISLNQPVSTDSKEITLEETISNPDDQYEEFFKKEEYKLLYKALDTLSDKDKSIFYDYYGLAGHEKITQKEISKKLGISQATVSRIIKRKLKLLRRKYYEV